MMRKHGWRIGFAVVASAFLSACGDRGSSPLGPREISGGLVATDTIVTDFAVASKGGRFTIGKDMKIEFGENSICDLTTTAYGPGQWDAPCTPSATTVRIRAKSWTDEAGHPRVDFTPAMRFVPGPGATVRLVIKDKEAALDLNSKITYCADAASICVDESVSDLSLVTYRDPLTFSVYRRIKHFSGYNVTARATTDADVAVAVEVIP